MYTNEAHDLSCGGGAPIFGRVLGLGFAGHRLAQVLLVEWLPLLHIGDFLSNKV